MADDQILTPPTPPTPVVAQNPTPVADVVVPPNLVPAEPPSMSPVATPPVASPPPVVPQPQIAEVLQDAPVAPVEPPAQPVAPVEEQQALPQEPSAAPVATADGQTTPVADGEASSDEEKKSPLEILEEILAGANAEQDLKTKE